MSTRKIQSVYYLTSALSDAAIGFAFGTYSVFLQSHGLTPLQMNMVNATFMLSVVLMEVPTGSIADAIGRRRSMILGALFTIIGSLTYFLSGSIVLFIVAEFLFATGAAFESGALDAWAVDSLLSKNYTGKTEMVFSVAYFTHRLISLRRSLLLLDHFIRPVQHRLRNREADLLRRLKIDHQLKLRWLLDRQISGLGTF